jgi:hypothetical protein
LEFMELTAAGTVPEFHRIPFCCNSRMELKHQKPG